MNIDKEIYELVQISRLRQPPETHLQRLTDDLGRQQAFLNDRIARSQICVARTKDEIAVLQMTIDEKEDVTSKEKRYLSELESESTVIARRSDLLRTLALTRRHPIRRLPAEAMAYILVLAVDTNVISKPYHIQSRRLSEAVPLSSVCSQWRDLIMSTPRSWSKISIYLHPSRATATLSAEKMEYLDATLKRAHAVPLTVTLEFHSFRHQLQDPETLWPQLTVLLNQPWQTIVLRHLGTEEGFGILTPGNGLRTAWEGSRLLDRLACVENVELEENSRGAEDLSSIDDDPNADHPIFDHATQPDNAQPQPFSSLRTLLLPPKIRMLSRFPMPLRQCILGPQLMTLRLCAGMEYTVALETLRSCSATLLSLYLHILPLPSTIQLSDLVVRFEVLRELSIVVEVPDSQSETYMTYLHQIAGVYQAAPIIHNQTSNPDANPSHPLTYVQDVLQRLETPSLQSLYLQRDESVGLPRLIPLSIPQYQPHEHDPSEQTQSNLVDVQRFGEFIHRSNLAMKLRRFCVRGFGSSSQPDEPTVTDVTVLEMLEALPGVKEVKIGEAEPFEARAQRQMRYVRDCFRQKEEDSHGTNRPPTWNRIWFGEEGGDQVQQTVRVSVNFEGEDDKPYKCPLEMNRILTSRFFQRFVIPLMGQNGEGSSSGVFLPSLKTLIIVLFPGQELGRAVEEVPKRGVEIFISESLAHVF